jgi:chromosome partitioning protein
MSMRTIAFATQKGGSGKSTLAIGIAVTAHRDDERVAILDTDPQGTIANWGIRRASPDPRIVRVSYAFQVERSLRSLAAEGYTLSIIDTAAGADRAATAAAIRAADLCLVPIRPSVPDVEATHSTLKLIREFEKPFAFVLNQTAARYEPTEAAAPLDAACALAHPFIVLRNDHQNAVGAGLGVSEFAPNGKAAGETGELWAWVKRKLDFRAEHNEQALVA